MAKNGTAVTFKILECGNSSASPPDKELPDLPGVFSTKSRHGMGGVQHNTYTGPSVLSQDKAVRSSPRLLAQENTLTGRRRHWSSLQSHHHVSDSLSILILICFQLSPCFKTISYIYSCFVSRFVAMYLGMIRGFAGLLTSDICDQKCSVGIDNLDAETTDLLMGGTSDQNTK